MPGRLWRTRSGNVTAEITEAAEVRPKIIFRVLCVLCGECSSGHSDCPAARCFGTAAKSPLLNAAHLLFRLGIEPLHVVLHALLQ
jgi:hypothetical protein